MGLPEGANVTFKDSTISTNSSFEVCLTPCRRQGIAGAFEPIGFGIEASEDDNEFEPPAPGDDLTRKNLSKQSAQLSKM